MRLTYTYKTTLEALYDRKYGSVYVALSKEDGRRWSRGWKTRLMCRIKGANSVTMPVGIQHMGDGSFYLIVNQPNFKQLCTPLGSEVSVSLWENPNTLGVDITPTIQTLLDSTETNRFKDLWDKLTDGQKRKLCFKTRDIKTDSLRLEKTLALFDMFEEGMIEREKARKIREKAKAEKQKEKELKSKLEQERKANLRAEKLKAGVKPRPKHVRIKKPVVKDTSDSKNVQAKAESGDSISSSEGEVCVGTENVQACILEGIEHKIEDLQNTETQGLHTLIGTDTNMRDDLNDLHSSGLTDELLNNHSGLKPGGETRKRRMAVEDDGTLSGDSAVGSVAGEELSPQEVIGDEDSLLNTRSKRRRRQVVKYTA